MIYVKFIENKYIDEINNLTNNITYLQDKNKELENIIQKLTNDNNDLTNKLLKSKNKIKKIDKLNRKLIIALIPNKKDHDFEEITLNDLI